MLNIDELQFTNSNGKSITIGRTGNFILSNRLNTSGISATSNNTKAHGQDGQTFHNNVLNPQDFTLEFYIKNPNPSDIREFFRKEVLRTFSPTLGEGTLQITTESGQVYYRDCSVDVAPYFPNGFENSNYVWQTVVVEMTANNPFFYMDDEIEHPLVEWVSGFEFTEGMEFSTEDTGVVTPLIEFDGHTIESPLIINDGETEAPLIIEIRGDCTNPRITNEITGKYIQLNRQVWGLARISTYDNMKKVVSVFGDGTELNIFNKLDLGSTLFQLPVGESVLRFTADVMGNAIVTIKYRKRYTGI